LPTGLDKVYRNRQCSIREFGSRKLSSCLTLSRDFDCMRQKLQNAGVYWVSAFIKRLCRQYNDYYGVLELRTVFQSLERCQRDFYNILGLVIFLQRLQKKLRGCDVVLEPIKTLRSLESCYGPVGNVLEVLIGRNL